MLILELHQIIPVRVTNGSLTLPNKYEEANIDYNGKRGVDDVLQKRSENSVV